MKRDNTKLPKDLGVRSLQTSVHLLNWGLYRSTSSRYNVSDLLVGFSRSPESYNVESRNSS